MIFLSKKSSFMKKLGLILAFCIIFTSVHTSADVIAVKAENTTSGDVSLSKDMSYSVENLTYELTNGSVYKLDTGVTSAGAIVYEMNPDIPAGMISNISLTLHFKIVEPDDRTIKGGDYIKIPVSNELTADFTGISENIVSGDGTTILTRSFDGENIILTFSDAINSDAAEPLFEVEGGIALNFRVDSSKLSSEKRSEVAVLPVLGENKEAHILFPQVITQVRGVENAGVVNKDDNTVSWIVTAGAASVSAGNSLKDVVIEDTFNSNDFDLLSVKNANGEDLSVVVTTEGAITKVSYTFPDGAVAPYVITVKTAFTENILNDATRSMVNGNQATSVTNNVKMSGGSAVEETTHANVEVPVCGIGKQGNQIDGNTLEWILILNDKHSNVYRATVIDPLSNELKIDEEYGVTVTLRDEDGNDTNSSITLNNSVKEGNLNHKTIRLTDAHTSTNASIEFASPFKESYKIVFRTKIDKTSVVSTNKKGTNPFDVIQNKAFVEVGYPLGGGGTGSYTKYDGTTVDTVFLTAFIDEVGTGADAKTGLLKWSVTPSCKTDFDHADITINTNTSDQDYVPGSFSLKTKAGNDVPDDLIIEKNDDFGVITVKVKSSADLASPAGLKLSDLRISYTTKAKTFFASNEEHEYAQTSAIAIHKTDETYDYSDTAKQKLINNVVEKYADAFFDDTTKDAYFHFQIIANRNEVNYTGLEVKDDLSNAIRLVSEGALSSSGTPLDMSWFDIKSVTSRAAIEDAASAHESYVAKYIENPDGTFTEDYQSGNLNSLLTIDNASKTAIYLNPLSSSDAVIIHLYVKINDKGKKALGLSGSFDNTIIADNTVTANADELSATFSANYKSKDNNDSIHTKQILKDGYQLTGDEASVLSWSLDINSAYLDNFPGGNEEIVITDTIPKGLTLDKKSIKLYDISHENVSGSGIVVKKGNHLTDITSDTTQDIYFSYTKNVNGTSTLKVTIKASSAYKYGRITYDTEMVKGASTFINAAILEATGKNSVTNRTYTAKNFDWASGSKRPFFWFYKADSLSDSNNMIPLFGAKYGLYNNANCKSEDLVDEAFSDSEGKVMLMGDKYDPSNPVSYYIKEISLSSELAKDYEVDETVYGPYNIAKGRIKVKPLVNGKAVGTNFVDKRISKPENVATAYIEKHFVRETNGIEVNGKSSNFELYVFPKTDSTAATYDLAFARKLTVLKVTDGEYKYIDPTEVKNIAGEKVTTLTGNTISDTNGKQFIKITDLPWGTYGLKETKTPDGFLMKGKHVIFKVSDKGGSAGVDFEMTGGAKYDAFDRTDTVGSIEYGVINNYQTKVTLIKADENGNELTDYSKVSYKVKPATGKKFADGTTDPVVLNGDQLKDYIFVGKFIPGVNYFVEESQTSVPDGYIRSADFSFSVNANTGVVTLSKNAPAVLDASKTTITVKETPTSVNFFKQDQNGKGIEGAALKITPVAGGKFAKITADEIVFNTALDTNGVSPVAYSVKGELIAGEEYMITETSSPSGYITPNAGVYVKIKVSTNGSVSVTDTGDGSFKGSASGNNVTLRNIKIETDITLKKVDGIDGSVLKGAVFYLKKNGTVIKTSTASGTDGKITFKDIPEGVYEIAEKTAPNHYKLSAATYAAIVSDGCITIDNSILGFTKSAIDLGNITNERKPAYIDLIKKDSTTGSPVAGATYSLYKKAGDEIVESKVTDSNGKIRFNIEWKTDYYVLESAAPYGYTVRSGKINGSDSFNFNKDLNKADETYTINTTDDPVVITFTLKNQKNEPVTGAAFVIKNASGVAVATFDTNSGNVATVTGIGAEADYTITQTGFNPYYKSASGMSITFRVASNGSVVMGDSVIPFTSDHKEAEYHNDGNVTLYNHKVLAGVILTKVDHDETAKVLSGAGVDLYKDGVLYGKYTTDDNGKVRVDNLPIGSYEFKENKAPVGYAVNNTDTFTFTVSESDFRTDDSKIYELTVKDKKTDVGFETKVETGNRVNGATESAIDALPDVTIKVYEDMALTRYVKDLVSESNGTVSLKSALNEGTYYIKLSSVQSENINLNNKIFKLIVSSDSKLIDTTNGAEVTDKSIVSTLDQADIEFVKVDATDSSKKVGNSTYGLFLKNASKVRMVKGDGAALDPLDESFVKVGETVSATDGAVKFTGLYAGGIYEIRELEAPAGYQLSKNPVEVTVKRTAFISKANITASGSATVTTDASGNLLWHEPRLYLRLDKVDESGALLAGANLELIDKASGLVIDSWISDDISGHLVSGVSAEAIKGGNTYILREVKEPEGYVKAADVEFVASIKSLAPGEPDFVQVVTLTNRKYVAPVFFSGNAGKKDKNENEPVLPEEQAEKEKDKKPANPHKQPEAPIGINDKRPLPEDASKENAVQGAKSPKTGQKRNVFVNLFSKLL